MGRPQRNVTKGSRRFSKPFGFVKTLALFLFTAGLALGGQPADDHVGDCVVATLRGSGAGCAAADLDADHQPDIALSFDLQRRKNLPSSISVHLSHGQPDQHLTLPRGRSICSFFARDMDDDGDLDIGLTGGVDETLGVFLNDGSGQFQFDESDRYRTGPSADFSHVTAPSRNDPATCSLAGGGTPYSLVPAPCSGTLVRATVLLAPESRAVAFRYEFSPVCIRAP
jgi:hypothetical protein